VLRGQANEASDLLARPYLRVAGRINLRLKIISRIVFALGISTAAVGCAVSQLPPVPVQPNEPPLAHQVEPEYRIQAADSLIVQSYYDPALKQSATVRPDGQVSLILVGDLEVAGKTAAELDQELKQRYWERLPAHPDIVVTIDQIASQVVYIGGEVKTPVLEPIRGSLTLLQSVMAAGGFLPTADQTQVIILRQKQNGEFHAYQQNAQLVLSNEASEVFLKPHDIVYVPKTGIAKADQFVDQYINEIIPQVIRGNFGYSFYDTTSGGATIAPAAAR
jgi:protein involved in polysaccharide export with SLBB domain